MSKLPLIYVAHQFGGKQFNLDRAEAWTAELNLHFNALFFAPWIPQCRHWENSGRTLERGIFLNEMAIHRSDAIIMVGGFVSPGMGKEIQVAQRSNVLVMGYWKFATPGELLSMPDTVYELQLTIAELRP